MLPSTVVKHCRILAADVSPIWIADGVDQNHAQAVYWFRKAADQGHPHASYNLAAAHLQGFDVDIQQEEVHQLIRHAAAKGVPEAVKALRHICSQGTCKE